LSAPGGPHFVRARGSTFCPPQEVHMLSAPGGPHFVRPRGSTFCPPQGVHILSAPGGPHFVRPRGPNVAHNFWHMKRFILLSNVWPKVAQTCLETRRFSYAFAGQDLISTNRRPSFCWSGFDINKSSAKLLGYLVHSFCWTGFDINKSSAKLLLQSLRPSPCETGVGTAR
jgi:hypothetical protein